MKICKRCGVEKSIFSFRIVKTNKNGTLCYKSICIDCMNTQSLDRYHNLTKEKKIERRKKSLEKLGPDYHKRYRLTKHYDLTLEEYQLMLQQQNNECYICRTHIDGKAVKVDHNHATGQVRKLLCHNCNTSLGLLKENPELFIKAAKYLKEHNDSI
jgi:hypothetical protein